jgi:hypothetical protein
MPAHGLHGIKSRHHVGPDPGPLLVMGSTEKRHHPVIGIVDFQNVCRASEH